MRFFVRADELARRLGVSRSESYARALANLLSSEDEDITARLNEVYDEEPRRLDREVSAAQARAIGPSDW